jgi:CxxC-x17-CxxC domain-containing protein
VSPELKGRASGATSDASEMREDMEYRDKTLVCVECHQQFVWTAGEQLFYADKNFKNEPKRCKAKRNSRLNHPQRERVETTATCSQCGKETTVPFKPTQGRPVYCKECFQQRKAAAV